MNHKITFLYKLKMGWMVWLRLMTFGLALSLIGGGFIFIFSILLDLANEAAEPGRGIMVILIYLVGNLICLPMTFFWAARWTGWLQGGDKIYFQKLKKPE